MVIYSNGSLCKLNMQVADQKTMIWSNGKHQSKSVVFRGLRISFPWSVPFFRRAFRVSNRRALNSSKDAAGPINLAIIASQQILSRGSSRVRSPKGRQNVDRVTMTPPWLTSFCCQRLVSNDGPSARRRDNGRTGAHPALIFIVIGLVLSDWRPRWSAIHPPLLRFTFFRSNEFDYLFFPPVGKSDTLCSFGRCISIRRHFLT